MRAVKKFIDRSVESLIMILMAVMALVVFWQVITRFILNNPSSWTEEASKYMMIWIAFLGGSMGLKYGTHMGLTIIEEKIKSTILKKVLKIICQILCIVVGVLIFYYGCIFTQIGGKKTGASVNIQMCYVYMVIPVSGIMIILNSVENIVNQMIEYSQKRPTMEERG